MPWLCSGFAQQTPSVPLCATGKLGRWSAQSGRGLAHYGLGKVSLFCRNYQRGPPFTDVDQACSPRRADARLNSVSNSTIGMSVGVSDATNYIDPGISWARGAHKGIQTGSTANQQTVPEKIRSIPPRLTPFWTYSKHKYECTLSFWRERHVRSNPAGTGLPIPNHFANQCWLRCKTQPTTYPQSLMEHRRSRNDLIAKCPQIDVRQFRVNFSRPAAARHPRAAEGASLRT